MIDDLRIFSSSISRSCSIVFGFIDNCCSVFEGSVVFNCFFLYLHVFYVIQEKFFQRFLDKLLDLYLKYFFLLFLFVFAILDRFDRIYLFEFLLDLMINHVFFLKQSFKRFFIIFIYFVRIRRINSRSLAS